MRFLIYVKGTKIKLTQPWEVHSGIIYKNYPSKFLFTLPKGTVLSIHDIDIRGNARPSKCMKFYILKDGCPKDPSLEQQTFTVSLAEAANAEFELNSKVDAKLNDLDLAILKIKEEVENEGS